MTGRPLNALGEFLAARRARVTPADVGLPAGGVRRVPGLRREEVATLTGLSVDYYARLEQGREQNPSASVLNALARTLQLDAEARRYLFAAAAPDAAAPDSVPEQPLAGATRLVGTHRVGENLLALVDDMAQHPALLLDECHNVLAGNPVGLALYAGSVHSDNLARRVFLDPSSRDLYREWPKTAASIVASIRAAVLHDRGDGALTALVGELSVASDEFAQLWAKAEVREKRSDIVRFAHPLVGDLDLTFETLRPASAPDLLLKIYRADRGSATEERLALLGILAAQDARPAQRLDESAARPTAHAQEALTPQALQRRDTTAKSWPRPPRTEQDPLSEVPAPAPSEA
jgi:transcriptional regulator with XRE-family HTH domain